MPKLIRSVVVGIGGLVPRAPINIFDPDYEAKSQNPANYHPAVLVRLPNGHCTPVRIEREGDFSTGDSIWYA